MTKIGMQAMDIIIGTHRKIEKTNEPDWEQRRYEIAKEISLHRMRTFPNSVKDDVESAVEWTNLLISGLKKEK